ncbi:MAG: hypothetical protein IPK17_29190 [Chloroflexi bacterium]|nr:hypothetical protein [Chloroflexota bacterium]
MKDGGIDKENKQGDLGAPPEIAIPLAHARFGQKVHLNRASQKSEPTDD